MIHLLYEGVIETVLLVVADSFSFLTISSREFIFPTMWNFANSYKEQFTWNFHNLLIHKNMNKVP